MSFESDANSNAPAALHQKHFDFDYDLLDKLLQGIHNGGDVVSQEGIINDNDLITPVPGTDERNNRLGSEWIKQLEQDLVHLIDDDTLSQTPSNSTSPVGGAGEDFFEREWDDFANLLSMNQDQNLNMNNDLSGPSPPPPLFSSTSEALNLNRELQGHLKTILERTTFLEQQQRELERVTDLLTSQVDKRIRKKNPSLPFWPQEAPTLAAFDKVVQEARGMVPLQQLNSNLAELDSKVKEYQKQLKIIPRWSIKERSCLAQGIRAQNERILLGIIQSKGTHSLEECKKIIESFSEVDLLMNVNGLDWENISQFFVQGRSANDCRLQWTINDHPMINRSPLFEDENREEIDKLKRIIPKVLKQVNSKGLPEGFCSPWQLIASQLGTNRTAIQCFMMYQKKLNPNFLKGKWTSEEDEQLMTAIKHYGTQNWQAVAQVIDGRTGQQCLHRYEKAINPEIKRGRWSSSEDELLKQAVKPFIEGSSAGATKIIWSVVKSGVPGRTDVQCRERWVNVLDPSLSAAPFTPEEDKRLLELVQLYGLGNWSKISQEMAKKRTDNQLWRRWKQIGKKQQQSKSKRKISNDINKNNNNMVNIKSRNK